VKEDELIEDEAEDNSEATTTTKETKKSKNAPKKQKG
jgi:hypothetical protein